MAIDVISVVIPHYNASDQLVSTVNAVINAASQEQVQVEIVVVDDGSIQPHRSTLKQLAGERVRVISCEQNLGRAGALNRGAMESTQELLLILDSDCQPASRKFFSEHLQTICGSDVSLGALVKANDNFWGRYQDLVVERRIRQFRAGQPCSFTTANMLIRRDMFRSIGGYDDNYRHYGFEDRDLLVRLQEAGARFAYSSGSSVVHSDSSISLPTVVRKMREAGRTTSGIFRARHPGAYRSLGYSRIDVRSHPTLRLIGSVDAEWLAHRIDPWLEKLPFPLALAMTRAVTACAYLRGTTEAASLGHVEGGSRRSGL